MQFVIARGKLQSDKKTIENRLKQAIGYLGLNQTEFANGIRVSQALINQVTKGTREAQPYLLLLIELVYGIRERWLVDGSGEMLITKEANKESAPHAGELSQLEVKMLATYRRLSVEDQGRALADLEDRALLVELKRERKK